MLALTNNLLELVELGVIQLETPDVTKDVLVVVISDELEDCLICLIKIISRSTYISYCIYIYLAHTILKLPCIVNVLFAATVNGPAAIAFSVDSIVVFVSSCA